MSAYLEALPERTSTWADDADCAAAIGVNPFLDAAWIEEDHYYGDSARIICKECPVRMMCLEAALNDPEAEGLRGGFFFEKGRVSRKDGRAITKELGIKAKTRTKSRLSEDEKGVVAPCPEPLAESVVA